MANSEENKKGSKPQREVTPQRENSAQWVSGLLKTWAVIGSIFRILIGAFATVLLIVMVCCFAMAGALADYLEVERSGLSAEISKMRKEGILEAEKNKFTLKDWRRERL